jgi:hypothetical protein
LILKYRRKIMGASGGGGGQQPEVIHPGEAAQAAVGTAGAGEMMSIANQPIEQYANLATTRALGPAEIQAQTALANQAAYQGAQAQMDIQSRVDPMAYAQRQLRLNATTTRLGQLYGADPTALSFRAPSAYAVPGTSDVPGLADLRAQGGAISSNLATAAVDRSGTNPRLVKPGSPLAPALTPTASYF